MQRLYSKIDYRIFLKTIKTCEVMKINSTAGYTHTPGRSLNNRP